MKNKKILVIDDDINLCQMMEFVLKGEGAEIYTALDGKEGLQLFYDHRPDLVILDVRMPGINGWETCRQIRTMTSVPVIMLTTLDKDEDIIKGLDSGADDFVSKPFSREVLMARVRAALRRSELPVPNDKASIYGDDYLTIDLNKCQVTAMGQSIDLTATEFQLLSYLLQNAGHALTYRSILENVWGWEYQNNIDYVHVYMSNLRRKIEMDPRNPNYFRTVRGIGYRFEKKKISSTPAEVPVP
ncbi:MAG: response regulator transcription factor [Chloroflexota bacterium]